jgi:hypothetical protein
MTENTDATGDGDDTQSMADVIDADVAGDLPADFTVHSKSGSFRWLHTDRDCPRLSGATKIQSRAAGLEADDRPICEWCDRAETPHGVAEDPLSTREKLIKMNSDKITTDGGKELQNESAFDPSDLARCGAARCPEVAEYHVTRDALDDPMDELRCAEHAASNGLTKETEIPLSERQIPDMAADDGTAVCFVADKLSEGDEVLFNDRNRELVVVDRHKKEINKTHRRRGSTRDYYDVVVLKGNRTTYHLLWQLGSGVGPMLRTQSQ